MPDTKKIEKSRKALSSLPDKNEYVIHIRNLKQVLKLGSILKKVHGVIQFNQETWLKSSCLTKLRTEAKNIF